MAARKAFLDAAELLREAWRPRASGRVTENAPSPTVRDGIAREVLPPFEFLPR